MNKRIKFGVTAATVGFTLTFAGLLAGIDASAAQAPPKGSVVLKLKGLAPVLKGDLKSIETVLGRLQEQSSIFYYFQHSAGKHSCRAPAVSFPTPRH